MRAFEAVAAIVCVLPLSGCLNAAAGIPSDSLADRIEIETGWLHTVGPDADPANVATAFRGPIPKPATLDLGTPGFEPTLGISPQGTIFVQATDLQELGPRVMRSVDAGQSWKDVTARVAGQRYPPLTFDPFLHVDSVTGRVFDLHMQGFNCNTLAWSDDQGEAWTTNPLGCGSPPLIDHPTLWTAKPRTATTLGYQNVVLQCAQRFIDAACSRSLDGGLTWSPAVTAYVANPPKIPDGQVCPLAPHGFGTAGPDGRNYLGWAGRHDGVPRVTRSDDDGITWTTHVIHPTLTTTSHVHGVCFQQGVESDVIFDHEVRIAVDGDSNVYALWIAGKDLLPYLSASTDHGLSWTPPVSVAAPQVRTTAFPAIAATGQGGIAVAYYGTSSDKNYSSMTTEDTWDAYVTLLRPVGTGSWAAATVASGGGDPFARGECGGFRCNGVGDFIDIEFDAVGRPWAAFVDTCRYGCVKNGSPNPDENRAVLVTFAAGPSGLDGAPLPHLKAPTSQVHAKAVPYETFRFDDRVFVAASGQEHKQEGFNKLHRFVVGENASALLVELRWESTVSDLVVELNRLTRFDTSTTPIGSRAGSPDSIEPRSQLRVVLEDPKYLQYSRYRADVTAEKPSGFVNAELAITVFYGSKPPAAFSGFETRR